MGFGSILWTAICYVLFAICCFDALVSIVVGGGAWIWDILLALLFCPFPGYREWKRRQFTGIFGRGNDQEDEFHVVQPENIPPLEAPEDEPNAPAAEPAPPKPTPDTRWSPIPGAVFAPLRADGTVDVPSHAAGTPVAYHYEDVGIYTPPDLDVPLELVDVGLRVSFRFEPENSYDKEAVAVYVGEWKIGYMNRSRHRDMLVDWANRRQPIWACITSIDDEKRKVAIFLVFYREPRRRVYEDLDDDDFDFDT